MAKRLGPSRRSKNKVKAVFLDRDDTLICSVESYSRFGPLPAAPRRPANTVDEVEMINGVGPALRELNLAGFFLFIVSNQGGIEFGFTTARDVDKIGTKIAKLLSMDGAKIEAQKFCPHFNMPCSCRKPKPGMILELANLYNIDLGRSYMVGDRPSDVQAAQGAGLRGSFVLCGAHNFKEADPQPTMFYSSWRHIAEAIILLDSEVG